MSCYVAYDMACLSPIASMFQIDDVLKKTHDATMSVAGTLTNQIQENETETIETADLKMQITKSALLNGTNTNLGGATVDMKTESGDLDTCNALTVGFSVIRLKNIIKHVQ